MTPETEMTLILKPLLVDLTEVLFDNSERFTCSEAETVAALYELAGMDDTAHAFIGSHAVGDGDGDLHQAIFSDDGIVVGWEYV